MEDFFNGAIAGAMEVVVNNPLVVIKNNLILNKKEKGTDALKKGLFVNPQNIVTKYYKGCGTGMILMAPITALQNSTTFLFTKILDNNPTVTQKTIAACCAGYVSAILASPADLIVLQRQNPFYTQESFNGTLQRIYRVNGLKTIYRGLNGTGIRDGVFTAAYKTGGNIIHGIVPTITGNTNVDKIICASLAGLMAAIVSHPADVISTRMKNDLAVSYYKTTCQTAFRIVKEEGASALFKGLTPRAFRIMLAIPLISLALDYKIGTSVIKQIKG